jgi:hypothetical protein
MIMGGITACEVLVADNVLSNLHFSTTSEVLASGRHRQVVDTFSTGIPRNFYILCHVGGRGSET